MLSMLLCHDISPGLGQVRKFYPEESLVLVDYDAVGKVIGSFSGSLGSSVEQGSVSGESFFHVSSSCFVGSLPFCNLLLLFRVWRQGRPGVHSCFDCCCRSV